MYLEQVKLCSLYFLSFSFRILWQGKCCYELFDLQRSQGKQAREGFKAHWHEVARRTSCSNSSRIGCQGRQDAAPESPFHMAALSHVYGNVQ